MWRKRIKIKLMKEKTEIKFKFPVKMDKENYNN